MTVDEIKIEVENARTLIAIAQVTGLGGSSFALHLNAALALVQLHDLVQLYVTHEDKESGERVFEQLYQVVLS